MKRNMKLAIGVIVVVAVVLALVYNYMQLTGVSSLASYDNDPVSIGTYLQLQSVATNMTLADQVGQGIAGQYPFQLPTRINGTPIVTDGKPTMIYIGAEYCPYCAVSRWGMVLALMRFGHFNTLHYMTSSATDVYKSTPTFTFYNSTYNSSYIDFQPVEETTNQGPPYAVLQTPDALQNDTFYTYNPNGGIPFIDFGNRSIQSGASVYPSDIGSAISVLPKYDWAQIISMLNQTNTTVSQAVIGNANIYTAQLCEIDNFTPASVCSAPFVKQILTKEGF